jgi:hypothetical protein
LREGARKAMPAVALGFALPVVIGVPLLLIGGSVLGTRMREALGLDAFQATVLLPLGIMLTHVPGFFLGRMTRGK